MYCNSCSTPGRPPSQPHRLLESSLSDKTFALPALLQPRFPKAEKAVSRLTRRVRLLLCVGVPSPGPIDRWEIATHTVNEVIFTPLNTTVLSTPLVVLVYASSWQCIQVGAVDRVDPLQIQPYFLNWIPCTQHFQPHQMALRSVVQLAYKGNEIESARSGSCQLSDRYTYVRYYYWSRGYMLRLGGHTMSGSCLKAAALSRTPQHVHDRLNAYTRSIAPPSVFST